MTQHDEAQTLDAPSGAPHVVPIDHRGMRVLTLDECLERLRGQTIGRVAFGHDGEIVVLPVNYHLDGVDVVFRTTYGSKLQQAADAGRVAFEVDWFDLDATTGGSVLVQGGASLVDDRAEMRRLEQGVDSAWVPSAQWFWVRVRPAEVSGRVIVREGDVE